MGLQKSKVTWSKRRRKTPLLLPRRKRREARKQKGQQVLSRKRAKVVLPLGPGVVLLRSLRSRSRVRL